MTTHNLFHTGNYWLYFPIVKYHRYNMTTGVRLQNVDADAGAQPLYATYYDTNGWNVCQIQSPNNVPPFAGWTVARVGNCPPDNFVGYVIGWSNAKVDGMANEASDSGQVRKKAYSSFIEGGRKAIAPLVYGDQANWYSGVSVLNTTDQWASITVNYYDLFGNQTTE
jgi:hypothetical protein